MAELSRYFRSTVLRMLVLKKEIRRCTVIHFLSAKGVEHFQRRLE